MTKPGANTVSSTSLRLVLASHRIGVIVLPVVIISQGLFLNLKLPYVHGPQLPAVSRSLIIKALITWDVQEPIMRPHGAPTLPHTRVPGTIASPIVIRRLPSKMTICFAIGSRSRSAPPLSNTRVLSTLAVPPSITRHPGAHMTAFIKGPGAPARRPAVLPVGLHCQLCLRTLAPDILGVRMTQLDSVQRLMRLAIWSQPQLIAPST